MDDFPSLNPGRIDPTNTAWHSTRKPLVAGWRTSSGQEFYTINVHLSSKGGSSSTQGDARPPVNLPVDTRGQQVGIVAVGDWSSVKTLGLKIYDRISLPACLTTIPKRG